MPAFLRLPFLALALACFAAGARAEEVKIPLGGLALNGELEMAPGKTMADGIILLVHGTLMHGRVELLAGLQKRLSARGLNSLAITLSLAIDDRHGNYDCTRAHRHRQEDAVGEIDAWIGWLKSRGATSVVVAGHSRGGTQAALHATSRDEPAVSRYILIAPATFDAAETAAAYETTFKTPLAPLLDNADALLKNSKGDVMLNDIGLLYCHNASVSAASFVSYYGDDGKKHAPDLTGAIKKPTLMVVAGNDTMMRNLDKLVAPDPPRLNVVTIDGADHFFLDLYLDDLADRIVEFLAK